MPSIKPKCLSNVKTGKLFALAHAQIQTSLVGIGVPFFFNSRIISE